MVAQKAEDFIGWKSEDGLLEVVDIYGRDRRGSALFKVICHKCKEDKELFPESYFVSRKGDLIKGKKPCGCSKIPKWKEWQHLIIARRVGKHKNFIVHGFVGTFKNQKTKLNLECLIDGHKWTASITSVVNNKYGCPECAGNIKKTESEALNKCVNICEEMNYTPIGFVGDTYSGAHNTYFEYLCGTHGKQRVKYHNFVNNVTRCGDCARDLGNGNGYYPDRKDEQDYLYVLDFDSEFLKVGRSFDVDERINSLRKPAESGVKNIKKIRIFTATHQEIYDTEQEIHAQLREKGFQYYVDWSTECFENECLDLLNNLLDKYKFVEIIG